MAEATAVSVTSERAAWSHRHLLDVDVLTRDELRLVLRRSAAMETDRAAGVVEPILRGRTLATVFAEASTRTRVSFEMATKALGGETVSLDAVSSSLAKGESLIDTARTLEALGASVLVVRHARSGAAQLCASHFGGNVVNAGDGWHAHPTQALLDLYTLSGRLGEERLAGAKVCIVGDVLHSRVARSNIWSLTAMGVDVWLTGPAVFLRGFEAWARALPAERRLTVTGDLASGIRGAAAVMALRVQRERLHGAAAPSEAAYAARWGLTEERLRTPRPGRDRAAPGSRERGRRAAPRRRVRTALHDHPPGRERRQRAHGRVVAPRGTSRVVIDAAAGLRVGDRVESLRLEDVWLVDPATGREGPGSLTIEDGTISAVQWDERVDRGEGSAKRGEGSTGPGSPGTPSLVVAPAFVDLHAHLREPGDDVAETFATGLAAAAHGGYAVVCAMPDTRPPLDRPEVVQRVRAAASAAGIPVVMRPYGTVTVGRAGQTLAPLPSLAGAGVCAFTDDPAPLGDPALLRAALTEAGALGRAVIVHADEPSLSEGSEANEGLPATILGLKGTAAAAEVSAVARAVAVLRQVSLESPPDVRPHLHLAHLSVAGALEPVRQARAEGLRVTCDVTPHHLALHDGWLGTDRRYAWDAAAAPWSGNVTRNGTGNGSAAALEGRAAVPYDTCVRVDPPLRSPIDALALLAAVADGTVDAVATDHAPIASVDKDVPFGDAVPGISSIETCLGLVLEAVAAGRLTLPRAMRVLSVGPWRVLGATAMDVPEPSLRDGAEASLVVFDRSDRWVVEGSALRSKGANSPLLGRSIVGRVLMTLSRGRVAHIGEAD